MSVERLSSELIARGVARRARARIVLELQDHGFAEGLAAAAGYAVLGPAVGLWRSASGPAGPGSRDV